ncbi:helix-turn-helix domain-containing protein [Streptomyces sp. URMC 123]|uniref:helix-turn-helix domain-containing protein n=1 Tax=Streptomyces sp. URMC 123 TaxID=3423403 RepID=UPI003F1C97E9
MINKDPEGSTLRYFGSQFRLWRTKAGMSREELADAIGYSAEMVKSVEQGRRVPTPGLISAADDVLGAGGLLKAGEQFLTREKWPNWFKEYALYEAEAAALCVYATHVVPGLLQTEEYARAVFRSGRPVLDEEEIERRLTARMERQALFTRTPPPALSYVLEQVILERPIGGKAVMKGQLLRLLECAELPFMDLQIMPTAREAHAALAGPMHLIETKELQRLVYCEAHRGSSLIADAKDVSDLNLRYGILRSQALTPEDSLSFLKRLLGEL